MKKKREKAPVLVYNTTHAKYNNTQLVTLEIYLHAKVSNIYTIYISLNFAKSYTGNFLSCKRLVNHEA